MSISSLKEETAILVLLIEERYFSFSLENVPLGLILGCSNFSLVFVNMRLLVLELTL